MPKRKKNWFVFAVKFVFSFAIIAYLLLELTPIRDIGEAIRGVDMFWLALSFSLHALGLLISARRWQILIHAQGDQVPLGFLAQSYLVGNFFIGGLIGWLVVDPLTGAMWTLSPDTIYTDLGAQALRQEEGTLMVLLKEEIPNDLLEQMVRLN